MTPMRPDLLSTSEASPAEKKLFERMNIKFILGGLLALIILGSIWYALAGPGRPVMEEKLASIIDKGITPTQRVDPSPLPSTKTPPQPSKTPTINPTVRPTSTPIKLISSPTRVPPTTTPTSSAACREALIITLADVGQAICVQGIVIETVSSPNGFMVIFSNQKGAFYWVSYDLVWSKAKLDTCYQVKGTIRQIGNSPVLLFNYSNLPEECP
jgi:hypothetical protein